MNLITKQYLIRWTCLTASVTLLSGLVSTRPAIAEPPALNKAPSTQAPDTQGSDTQTLDSQALANFRATYESMMSTFDFLLAERGDTYGQDRVAAGRESMKAVTDKALARVFSQTGIPDISGLSVALSHLMAKHATHQSKVIPDIAPVPSGCSGVAYDNDELYSLLIDKEFWSSLLAAAQFVCTQDVLGENGSTACVPLAIAYDIANGLYDTASLCAGSFTGNETDAIYAGLSTLENDVTAATTTIESNDNANKASIILNDNANTTTLFNQATANTTTIVNNDNANTSALVNQVNANTTTIVNNDNSNSANIIATNNANRANIIATNNANTVSIIATNNANTVNIIATNNANTTAIINNANANKTEIENLILRTQIEQSLTVIDNGAQVALFELPNAHGGYLDLVTTIVTQTLANIQAAGGSIGTAQPFLTAANTAKAAGNFKLAYFNYKQAYQLAGH